jgi:hypothetical protein
VTRNADGTKTLTVAQLKRTLEQLPDDSTVQVNSVANLMVCGADGFYNGWIDFNMNGEYHDDTVDDDET